MAFEHPRGPASGAAEQGAEPLALRLQQPDQQPRQLRSLGRDRGEGAEENHRQLETVNPASYRNL